jgi:N-acetylneuraminic acid mutarotase
MAAGRFSRAALQVPALWLLQLLTAGVLSAGQPVRFNYQGRLSDSGGAPLSGSHTIHFKLFSGGSAAAADSGSLVYYETAVVTAANGGVTHAVGSGTPVSGTLDEAALAGSSDFYLQIGVDSAANTVLPRTRLESVPFAVHALSAESAANGLPAGFVTLGTSATPPAGFSFTGRTLFTPWLLGARITVPTPRYLTGAAVHDGKVYLIGGAPSGGVPVVQNAQLDLAKNTWIFRAPMPTARRGLACAEVGGFIYAFGGDSGPSSTVYYGTTERFDPAANNWVARQSMTVPRTECAAAVVGGKVYIIGGRSDTFPGPESTAVEEYDPVFNSFTPKAPMPTGRARCGAAAINGRIYVVGGYTGAEATTTTLEEYDPAANTWTTKAPMPDDRARHAAAAAGGKLCVYGGYSAADANVTPTTFVYDPASDTWTTGISMLFGAGYLPGVSDGTRIYAIGGLDETGAVSNKVQFNDPTVYFLHMKN